MRGMTDTQSKIKGRPGPKGGVCRYCRKPTGSLKYHERFCADRTTNEEELDRAEGEIIRAGAHAAAPAVLRPAQRFQNGVDDLMVARVMRALEDGVVPYLRPVQGTWCAPAGTPVSGLRNKLSNTIKEMIRTGLVRHFRDREGDHLIPAKVHARNRDDRNLSACLFTGEDMGPMRSRLADDLRLVDCLDCEAAIAQGQARGL